MIHEDSTPTMFHMLDSGSLDLLITAPGGSEQDLRRDYKMHALALSGLKYCVSRNHRWAQRKSVTMEEMAKEPLVMLSNKYSSSQSLVDMFADQGLEPHIILRTSQMFTIERFVEAGAAAGFLPAELPETNRSIVSLSFPNERKLRHTTLVWKKGAALYPSVECFIRVAKELYHCKEQLI